MRVPPSVSAQPLLGRAIYLGHIDYALAWRLQLELVERRVRGEIPDTVLLCQHLDVITVGRRQRAQANILDARFPVFEVERGGDATYHGPGQLVGYPILLLRPGTSDEDRWGERDLHAYLRGLEEALCLLCAQLGVSATRKEGYTGVWTADQARKLASLGIAVRRWVTFHGFALNVTTELSRFHTLNPCGLAAQVMTSLAAEGGQLPAASEPLSVESLLQPLLQHLGAVLSRQFALISLQDSELPELLQKLRSAPQSGDSAPIG